MQNKISLYRFTLLVWFGALVVLFATFVSPALAQQEQLWRGLLVRPEQRCAPYEKNDYRYSPKLEAQIVAQQGGLIISPYDEQVFSSTKQTDIEHIVARSQAHDSGLCARDAQTKREFANDLLNLTLASPQVNRCSRTGKCDKDAAQWLPQKNQCWFASRVLAVRQKYQLSIDRAEAEALDQVFTHCERVARGAQLEQGLFMFVSNP